MQTMVRASIVQLPLRCLARQFAQCPAYSIASAPPKAKEERWNNFVFVFIRNKEN